jgi:putative transposase
MPFKETCPVEERIAMFRDYDTGAYTVADLCRLHGVSRETFYVWKRRRESGEERWFEERSRSPVHRPHETPSDHLAAVIAMRRRYPHFGPKKIRERLKTDRPDVVWPAASTIGDILKRAGLMESRRRQRRAIARGELVAPARAPNDEWSIDFKGWFRTRDGERCDPLTLADSASRYLLQIRIVEPTYAGVRCALERLFDEVGLPDAIRSDNGAPFGSTGAGGLSTLSVWWLRLGIEPRYIPPSSPQDNGRH